MVFQFEHVGIGDGPLGKWTTKRYDFMQLKKILSHWQTGLTAKPGTACSGAITISPGLHPAGAMTRPSPPPRCWLPAC